MSFATVTAIGASTGMSGSTKPLEALEQQLLGQTRSARTAIQGQLQDRLKEFARRAGARVGGGKKPSRGPRRGV